ncbi:hypothetical protein LWI29_021268 [Acer saccharum]|uniref:Alpha-galactosidase n=1 Tax=Acer saccharum TaxID=4024 RepID=A0AA39VGT4_ACESA|nr:hypothetical protein LWI29_021268 [Acer saccharum]
MKIRRKVDTSLVKLMWSWCLLLSSFMVMGAVSSSVSDKGATQEKSARLLLWGGIVGNWNHFGCNINEKMFKETADALVSTCLSKLGYSYVNIGLFNA